MSALEAGGAPHANGTPDEEHALRCTWVVSCTDVIGRPYELKITAYRAPLQPGIGLKAPAGEFAYVDINHTPDFVRALTEAHSFLQSSA